MVRASCLHGEAPKAAWKAAPQLYAAWKAATESVVLGDVVRASCLHAEGGLGSPTQETAWKGRTTFLEAAWKAAPQHYGLGAGWTGCMAR